MASSHTDLADTNSIGSTAFKALSRGFRRAAGLDIDAVPPATPLSDLDDGDAATRGVARFGWTVVACALTTVVAVAMRGWLNPANLVMLYLLVVVLMTVRFGRGVGIAGSFLAVLAFDVFLVPPYYSLTVADTEYVLTFVIMLVVSLIISHLTANLRQQVSIAYARERRAQALFNLSTELSGALTREKIGKIGTRHVRSMFGTEVFLLFSEGDGALRPAPGISPPPREILDAARRVFDCLGSGKVRDNGLTVANAIYLPLQAPARPQGILVLASQTRSLFPGQEQEQLLQTVGAQIALASERIQYVELAQASTMAMESERLRNSLLSAISHDVRTPLTAIIGMTSVLAENRSLPQHTKDELASAIRDNALRMSELVSNLLDMARLQAGKIALNRQWQMLEEVVGSALALLSPALEKFRVTTSLPQDLPLLAFDAVLIERVLCNLFDNAAKYAAAGQTIHVMAEHHGASVHIAVEDCGPGIPAGMEEVIFQKFARVHPESVQPGIGLGLAICRTIVEAHHGRIWAEKGAEGGARFVVSLPVGTPPAVDGLFE